MKINFLITKGKSKQYKRITIPEPISLNYLSRHILWNGIIIPEMKNRKGLLKGEAIIISSLYNIKTNK